MNSEISASKRKLEVEIEQIKDEKDEMKQQKDLVRSDHHSIANYHILVVGTRKGTERERVCIIRY